MIKKIIILLLLTSSFSGLAQETRLIDINGFGKSNACSFSGKKTIEPIIKGFIVDGIIDCMFAKKQITLFIGSNIEATLHVVNIKDQKIVISWFQDEENLCFSNYFSTSPPPRSNCY